MERKILKRVGEGGSNLSPDVVTVQELLNGVAANQGGAKPPLKVDGVCGRKTKNAIQVFQLKHFGWKLADARVDPEGATLAKLNEHSGGQQRSAAFMLFQSRREGPFRRSRPGDWFFLVEQVGTMHPFPQALFWFGAPGAAPLQQPSPAHFGGAPWSLLKTSRACGLGDLAGPASVRRQQRHAGPPSDFTELHSDLGHPIRYNFPLVGGLDSSESGGPGVIVYQLGDYTFTEVHAFFQAVG